MGRAFEYRRAAKEKRWANMSRIFPKLARSITVAAKLGGIDPDLNPRLRTAINNAKTQNMPKDNIDAAIKRSLGKDAELMSELFYEARTSAGILMIVEALSDNPTRTVANVKAAFNKAGATTLNSGSLKFMFDRKSVVEIENLDLDLEELELELIDSGLELLEKYEESVYLYADYASFGELTNALDKKNIPIKNASLQYVPNSPQEFSEDAIANAEKLIEKLEDDEDVQRVFTNIL